MRTITQKDKKALVPALRVFMRACTGERLPAAKAEEVIGHVLGEGITVDALLNRGNWMRALAEDPGLDLDGYVRWLCDGANAKKVLDLKEEPNWHEPSGGWTTVAEAAHDFYMAVTGKGGKWNIPSALMNLAKAVSAHSLQAILSEELIAAVTGGEETTFFDYILAIAKDFNTLPVDDTPTAEQFSRNVSVYGDETAEKDDPAPAPVTPYLEEDTDDPFPEADILGDGYHLSGGLIPDPMQEKRKSIANAIYAYTPQEILLLTETMEDAGDLSLSEIVDRLTSGEFDPAKESPAARQVHMALSGELSTSFIETVRMQQYEMDEAAAKDCDILHDSWDFRDKEVRKLHKLKKLIYASEELDDDLLEAVHDIERLYSE